MVKNLPASVGDARDAGSTLSGEDPLEEGVASHSRILVWKKNPLDTETWWAIVHWVAKSQTQPAIHTHVPNTYMLMK